MGILGIDNRTENWKTALCFSPFFGDRSVALAKKLGESSGVQPSEVRLELYWKGVRDWVHKHGGSKALDNDWLVECYNRKFSHLQDDLHRYIEEAGRSQTLNRLHNWNYVVSAGQNVNPLRNNLINTEIDIVLETPNCLFIGEAKHQSDLGADSRYILVHQLIRQYVMATMLIDKLREHKKVIPFVVGPNTDELIRHHQVKFMIHQGWLNPDNVLSWTAIKNLASVS